MRFTVSSEQLRFFHTHHYLPLDALMTEAEEQTLIQAITRSCIRTPGYPPRNFFRSIPLIAILAKRRGWGQIATALIKKQGLSLSTDRLLSLWPKELIHLEEENCGLILTLEKQQGIFFKGSPPPAPPFPIDNPAHIGYLLIVLTGRRPPDFPSFLIS